MRRLALLITKFVLASLLESCAQKTLAPSHFTPAYQSRLEQDDVAVVERKCVAIAGLDVSVSMKGPVIGTRRLESNAVAPQPITINGNPIASLEASSREMLRRAMVKTTAAAAPRLKLRLMELQMSENVYVNADYEARAQINASLITPAGRECWAANVTGFARKVDEPGLSTAYQDTTNLAIDRAIIAITRDASFQDAVCATCAD